MPQLLLQEHLRLREWSSSVLLHPETPAEVWPTQAVTKLLWLFLHERARNCNLCVFRVSSSPHPSSGLVCEPRGKAIPWLGLSPALPESVKLLSTSLHGFHSTIKWQGYSRATLHFHLHTTSSQQQRGEGSAKGSPTMNCTAGETGWDEKNSSHEGEGKCHRSAWWSSKKASFWTPWYWKKGSSRWNFWKL